MTDEDVAICREAISILRSTPPEDKAYRDRLYLADQIELQILVGNPCYDAITVQLCKMIVTVDANMRPSAI